MGPAVSQPGVLVGKLAVAGSSQLPGDPQAPRVECGIEEALPGAAHTTDAAMTDITALRTLPRTRCPLPHDTAAGGAGGSHPDNERVDTR